MNLKKPFRTLVLLLICLSLALPGLTPDAYADEAVYTETALPGAVTQVVDAGEGYAVVQNAQGQYAVLNAAGEYLISWGTYLWIDAYSENLARVKTGTAAQWSWGFADLTGTLVLDLSGWDEVGSFHNGLARVRADSRLGFIDATGAFVLDCSQYSEVGEFSDGYARVATVSGDTVTYGFIDVGGNTIIGGLQSATDFSGGYALVQLYNTLSRKTVTCLIDTTGTTTVDLSEYTNLSAVSDGLLLVSPQAGTELDSYGYMDRTGEVVIPCPGCEFVYPFSDGLALTEYLDSAGTLCYAYLDTDGNTFLDLGSCQVALPYEDGYAIYEDASTWYLMDTQGAVVFSSRSYTSFDSFSEGVLVAARADGYGNTVYDLLTADGTPLASGLAYDRIDAFSDSLALATRYDAASGLNHYVFLDSAGTVVLDCSDYDDVSSFAEGKLLVSTYRTDNDGHFAGTKSLFLDKTGAQVLDCSGYSSVESFSDGLVLVTGNDSYTLADTYQFLDASGNVALDCSAYTGVTAFRDGVSVVSRTDSAGTNQYALMDTAGTLLTDWLDYHMVSGYSEGYAVVYYTATQGTVSDYFYMNTDGTVCLSDLGYDSYTSFSGGLAIVGSRGRYGCIDKDGNLVIDLTYDEILPFSGSVTWARRNGTWYCLSEPAPEPEVPAVSEPDPAKEPDIPSGTGGLSPLPTFGDELPFTDIPAGAWYLENVRLAYAYELMNGITATTFDPDGTVTLAQAVTMAVRAHHLYYGLDAVQMGSGDSWYLPYVEAGIQAGILTGQEFSDYTRPATRAELAYLFAHVLSKDAYGVLNPVLGISDVSLSHTYSTEILEMYQAGVLTGYEDGSFRPDNTVCRREVAAIITRVILPDQRVASN